MATTTRRAGGGGCGRGQGSCASRRWRSSATRATCASRRNPAGGHHPAAPGGGGGSGIGRGLRLSLAACGKGVQRRDLRLPAGNAPLPRVVAGGPAAAYANGDNDDDDTDDARREKGGREGSTTTEEGEEDGEEEEKKTGGDEGGVIVAPLPAVPEGALRTTTTTTTGTLPQHPYARSVNERPPVAGIAIVGCRRREGRIPVLVWHARPDEAASPRRVHECPAREGDEGGDCAVSVAGFFFLPPRPFGIARCNISRRVASLVRGVRERECLYYNPPG